MSTKIGGTWSLLLPAMVPARIERLTGKRLPDQIPRSERTNLQGRYAWVPCMEVDNRRGGSRGTGPGAVVVGSTRSKQSKSSRSKYSMTMKLAPDQGCRKGVK